MIFSKPNHKYKFDEISKVYNGYETYMGLAQPEQMEVRTLSKMWTKQIFFFLKTTKTRISFESE